MPTKNDLIWDGKYDANGDKPFGFESETDFEYDVQKRVPDTTKARKTLGFEAQIPLEQGVAEMVDWVRNQLQLGKM